MSKSYLVEGKQQKAVLMGKTAGADSVIAAENAIGKNTAEKFLLRLVDFTKERKARDIVSLDLKGLSVMCDYFLICTANNSRQVQSIADYIISESRIMGANSPRVEGYRDAKWVLMDFGDIIVHIFTEEERNYFNLERLWGDAVKQVY